MRAIIVGGGIAGPAVASFLTESGWSCEVLEADEQPDPYGGLFLNVASNGLAVLEDLGVRDRLLTEAHPSAHLVMWGGRGKRLGAVPMGPAGDETRGGVVVTRAWLHEVVRDAALARGVRLTQGAQVVGISQTSDAVVARLSDGREVEGDVLIGCDGIGSVTRTYIDADAPAPIYSGLVGLGGYAHGTGLPPTPGEQHFVFGRRSFFGYLVREDGTVYWFANVTAPDADREALRDVPSEEWRRRLRELHVDDPDPVPRILERSTSPLRAYPIDDLHGVPRWSRGRVVALGDAMHATSPSAGQGASMAFEDAVALAVCLREHSDPAKAFAAFQRSRQPRVERIATYARAINARKRVSSNPVTMALRDWMLPMFLRRAAADTTNDWVYDHRIPWQGADRTRRIV